MVRNLLILLGEQQQDSLLCPILSFRLINSIPRNLREKNEAFPKNSPKTEGEQEFLRSRRNSSDKDF